MRPRDHVYFGLFRSISLDLGADSGVDVVGDAHCLPILDERLDAIVAQAVLEHVLDPAQIIKHAWRALRPGGLIYIAVPFMQPYHYGPLDYRRYTLRELERVMTGFEKIESGVSSGPGLSLAWFLRAYLSSFAEGAVARRFLDAAGGWLGFLFKYTDLFLARKRTAEIAASAYYYLGRRPM